ncbi:MAG TPA: hypothetical protein H9850_03630 [Candidatus Anaerobiospirillum pullistercoris]|uniref:Uncharacterized protein n=1 Tax=Candidatus Anaerobiospirillum pullistercoris TaxID=2838452 RepID=A0A9D1WCY5_9GAMM|nr:hypothetical protein [Candidatus Anaerobiospirillum pullistercoris]
MQYMLKLTPLGVQPHIFRVVSVDGQADIDHVLSLCDLSFDYAHYAERALYFARDLSASQALAVDVPLEDNDHYGPVSEEFAPFWRQELELAKLELEVLDLQAQPQQALQRFDALLEAHSARLGAALKEDTHPREQGERFKFVYVVHGVQHLVEVLMSSEKLNCFVPATLMGEGLVVDDDPLRPLSTALINASVAAAEAADAAEAAEAAAEAAATEVAAKADAVVAGGDAAPEQAAPAENSAGLNLKVCTSRMRAFGAMRSEQSINQALQQAGASPLTIKIC